MTTHYAGIGEPQTLPLDQLNLHYKNPRRGDVDAIKGSLIANGNFRPIVVNKGTYTGRPWEVLAGNHTLKATRALAEENPDDKRWHQIDCWVVDVDEERATKIVLADNRTADLGAYDDDTLAALLETVDHDLDGTGYDHEDLSDLEKINNGEELPEPGDAEQENIPVNYAIVVECNDLEEQQNLLDRFLEEGLECRSIM
ncbi:ParB N-terminal domain-containing protein [Corynebacterium striatum]|uniref:ParB N-terminal domain-containing protein n=1 Tax=Corynebacterium striatum TaxID=43770 RepID=UPI003AEAC5CD